MRSSRGQVVLNFSWTLLELASLRLGAGHRRVELSQAHRTAAVARGSAHLVDVAEVLRNPRRRVVVGVGGARRLPPVVDNVIDGIGGDDDLRIMIRHSTNNKHSTNDKGDTDYY